MFESFCLEFVPNIVQLVLFFFHLMLLFKRVLDLLLYFYFFFLFYSLSGIYLASSWCYLLVIKLKIKRAKLIFFRMNCGFDLYPYLHTTRCYFKIYQLTLIFFFHTLLIVGEAFRQDKENTMNQC